MRIACSTMRAQSRPRSAQVPRPTIGMRKPLASTAFIESHDLSFSFGDIIGEAAQEQGLHSGRAAQAMRNHGVRHDAFKIVVEKAASLVARCDPSALHFAQLAS